MYPEKLNWTRFWLPVSADNPFVRGGFLEEPSIFTHMGTERPVTLEDLTETPALILLGEAGAGKSTTIENACGGLDEYIDLAAVDQQTLRHELHDAAARVGDGNPVTLWLDSLDECRLGIEAIEQILARELKRLPDTLAPCLRVRLASRNVIDLSGIRSAFAERWSARNVAEYKLCPLTRNDARLAAAKAGCDADAFLESVEERRLEGLANRPKTLRYLIRQFHRAGDFPTDRWSLYEASHRHLMEEAERRAHRVSLTADARLRIAAHIAAITVLTQKPTIVRAGRIGADDETCVSIDDLVIPPTEWWTQPCGRPEIEETLNVGGPFQQSAAGGWRFEHRSDAEFLAAWYLRDRGLPEERIRQLVEAADDATIPPQMVGLIAWLAAGLPRLRQWLIESKPAAALEYEVVSSDDDRHAAVQSMLKQATEHSEIHIDVTGKLGELDHPGIPEQLRPWVAEQTDDVTATYLALQILVHTGHAQDCLDDLLRMLNDTSEVPPVRQEAARAAGNLLSSLDGERRNQIVAALYPHATDQHADGLDIELKGVALMLLWPADIETRAVFTSLMPRSKPNVGGTYDQWLRKFAGQIPSEELPIALDWIATGDADAIDRDPALVRLREELMRAAWEHIEDDRVLHAFVPAAAAALRNHHSPFSNSSSLSGNERPDPLDETEKRRRLVLALAEHIPEPKIRGNAGVILLRDEDREWLVDRIVEAGAAGAEPLCDFLPAVLAWDADRRWIDRVLDLADPRTADRIPGLRARVDDLGGWVCMEDAEAIRRRREQERRLARPETPEQVQATVRQALAAAWQTAESSQENVWMTLLAALSSQSTRGRMTNWPHAPVEALPGWPQCDQEDIHRARAQAAEFVARTEPSQDFLAGDEGETTCTYGDAAAYHAWDVLICDGDGHEIPSDALGKWRALLTRMPLPRNTTDTRRQKILRYLSESAPDSFPAEFEAALRLEIAAEPNVGARRLLRHVDAVWSNRIAGVLRDVAAGPDCSRAAADEIRAKLLEHGDQKTEQELRRRLAEGDRSAASQDAAVLLLKSSPGAVWSVIGPYLTSLGEDAQSVLGRVIRRYHLDGADAFRGYPMAMAEFYALLDAQYGEGPDPLLDNDSASGDEFAARHIRSTLLGLLAEEGTWEAVRALECLRAQVPERNAEFRMHLNAARQNAIARNWTGPGLHELTTLFADTSRRVVRSNTHLLSVVVESLKTNLVHRLHGETPMAPFLWEEGRQGPDGEREITHKPEERISDFLHDHLRTDVRDRRLVIHREVQIHNPNPKGRGTQADLMVDAAAVGDGDDVCSVVVEVKGAWSREILTAMEEQLIGTYMHEHGCDTGLYVGIWTGEESRRTSKAGSAAELQAQLDEQAAQLSGSERTLQAVVLDITLPR